MWVGKPYVWHFLLQTMRLCPEDSSLMELYLSLQPGKVVVVSFL